MASIGFYTKNNSWNHLCGATLISHEHFLTAAHCVNKKWVLLIKSITYRWYHGNLPNNWTTNDQMPNDRTPNFTTSNDRTPNCSNAKQPNAEFYNIEPPEYRILNIPWKIQLVTSLAATNGQWNWQNMSIRANTRWPSWTQSKCKGQWQ
jgi:hypothetical protein